ncbi:hypothetical protein [Paraclostridium bifermentans]|uniref:hypothetical protein n=1 Tax=Paraclostridium bifermentans TaxID=1490 RepID=UPI00374F5681
MQHVNELVDNGEFWEYISVIFEKSIAQKEDNNAEVMKLLQKLQADMQGVKSKLDEQPKVIQTLAVTAEQSSTQPPASTESKSKEAQKLEVQKATPVKSKPRPKGGLIGKKKKTGRG